MEIKPHWERLIKQVEEAENGDCHFKFQDKLPVLIIEIRGEKNNIDLTK